MGATMVFDGWVKDIFNLVVMEKFGGKAAWDKKGKKVIVGILGCIKHRNRKRKVIS